MIKLLVVLSVLIVLQFANNVDGFSHQSRIVNGILSKPSNFPYFVTLAQAGVDPRTRTNCGGTIISDRWIVTAAHCIDKQTDKTAHFGIDSNGDLLGSIAIKRENYFIHPEHSDKLNKDNFEIYNDIALLKLPQPIKFNAFVQPVTFSANCDEYLNSSIEAIAIGNGETNTPIDYIGFFRDIKLRQVDVRIISKEQCDEIKPISVDGSIYCSYPLNGQSIYHGDSGGPLLRKSDGTMIGVTSALIRYDVTVTKQYFTRIHHYFDWISEITGLELPKCR